jgi:hypothetical protein
MKYLITIEREGEIVRAFVWQGRMQAGIAYAKVEAIVRGIKRANIFAEPIANTNESAA